jgi:DNA (cytosine-5)-methyltransferase 1
MKNLTSAGVFGGIGSGLLGARWAGFTPQWLFEPRPFGNEKTWKHNFGDLPFLTAKNQLVDYCRGELDLLIGQPDCKQFSNLGTKRKDRGKIDEIPVIDIDWYKFLETAYWLQSKSFILENVPNVKNYFWFEENRLFAKGFKGGKEFYARMEGYDIITIDLRATEFGVPQTRNRTYIIGIRKDANKYDAGMDIQDLISFLENEYKLEKWRHQVADTVDEAFRRIHELSPNQTLPKHTPERTAGMARLEPGESYYGTQNNRRLFLDRPSGTVASHCSRFVHPSKPRVLTVRETATLQGFPQEFQFFGSDTGQLDQVGKAIVPQVTFALALYIKSMLK